MFLGAIQMVGSVLSALSIFQYGLLHPTTYTLVTISFAAMVASRLLFRGRRITPPANNNKDE